MRRTHRAFATALPVVLAGSALALANAPANADPADTQQRVIVTLAGDAALEQVPEPGARSRGASPELAAARAAVRERHDDFLDDARDADVHGSDVATYDLLANAVAMTVAASEVDELASLPGVQSVHVDMPVTIHTDNSVPFIGAPSVWEMADPAGTGATGEGVTVAVLDTGVDYTHPDLGGCFGDGCKVVGGYDYVNDDSDPIDDHGHGTHVAGIIGAHAAAEGGITGVAPGVSITAYKVLDQFGAGSTEAIVAALEAAIDPDNPYRADVINMSLGGPSDGTDPLSQASAAAVEAGIVVVTSAGNDGPGAGTVSSPGLVDSVITVGASTTGLVLPIAHLAGAEPVKVQTWAAAVSANAPAEPVTAELVDVGFGSDFDFDNAGDVTGKIVMVNADFPQSAADTFSFHIDLAERAQERGALAMIAGQGGFGFPGPGIGSVGSQADGLEPGVARLAPNNDFAASDLRVSDLVVLGMDTTQRDELVRSLGDGTVEITISGEDITDHIASFSSRGPTNDFRIKPDLVAPGVEILSTVPTTIEDSGQYAMSGTSMAAPHVAGAAALILQLDPDLTPAETKATLVGSAHPLAGTSPTVHGSGRLAAAAAARTAITATPSAVNFGLAGIDRNWVRATEVITLHNDADVDIRVRLDASSDEVSISPRSVKVKARSSQDVTIRVKARTPDKATDLEGWVTGSMDGEPVLTVPYYLPARPLIVHATPDPVADGAATVWLIAPTNLGEAPTVTLDRVLSQPGHSFGLLQSALRDRAGHGQELELTQVSARVYSAELTGLTDGIYELTAEGETAGDVGLVGASTFEVLADEDGEWTDVGPISIGGDVSLTPAAPDQAVVTQETFPGVWVTTDDGASWSSRDLPVVFPRSAQVIVDATNPDLWWYAANADTGNFVFATNDGGQTWEPVHEVSGQIIGFVSDSDTSTLAVATSTDVAWSVDGGDTWSSEPHNIPGPVQYVALGGDDLFFAAGRQGIWEMAGITSGSPEPAVQAYDSENRTVNQLVADDGVVATIQIPDGVVGSTDGGETWGILRPQFFGSLWISNGVMLTRTSADGLVVSEDYGSTWNVIPSPEGTDVPLDFEVWADGSMSLSMTGAILRGPLDGSSYQRWGIPGGRIFDLAVVGDELLAGTPNGVYRSAFPAESLDWGEADGEGTIGGGAEFLEVSPHDPNQVWRIRQSAFGSFAVQRSHDGGQSWLSVGDTNQFATALAVHPADADQIMVGFAELTKAGLYASTDGGANWKKLFHGMLFEAIAGDPNDPDVWWLGNAEGLWRSEDRGQSVTKVAEGAVTSILFTENQLVVGGHGIRISDDGGSTFRSTDSGVVSILVSDLIKVDGVLYASTFSHPVDGFLKGGRGVLASADGQTWHSISAGMTSLEANALAASPDGAWLFAGTDNGVLRLPIGE